MDNQDHALFSFYPDHHDATFQLERGLARAGYPRVAGLDEAGRGPLAGPVVAGCVVLPDDCDFSLFRDSKKLTAARRDTLFELLFGSGAAIGWAVVEADEIDRVNILQASLMAMARSVAHLIQRSGLTPDFLLVDGKFPAPVDLPQKALVRGESKSASIAAASIIAKVTRDRIMARYHDRYPQYGFAGNKGYPTAGHRRAIEEHGPCPIHRRTFKGVREYTADRADMTTPEQGRLWQHAEGG